MVQSLERHAGGHRAISHDTHHFMLLTQLLPGFHHPERRRDPSAGVARVEGVEDALLPLAEPAQSAKLPECVKLLTATGQQLVRIGLIAGIPDDLIVRRIEEIVQCDRQFDNPQIGGEMPSHAGDGQDDLLTDFLAQFRELLRSHPFQIRGAVNSLEQRHTGLSPLSFRVVRPPLVSESHGVRLARYGRPC